MKDLETFFFYHDKNSIIQYLQIRYVNNRQNANSEKINRYMDRFIVKSLMFN